MQFRTEISPLNNRGWITHGKPIVLLGSCFSHEIGQRMLLDGFNVTSNPFGQIYSPDALRELLQRLSSNLNFSSEDLIQHNGLWHTYLSHTSLSGERSEDTLLRHRILFRETQNAIKDAQCVILTLGSHRTFYHNNKAVANCHKLPTEFFSQQLASPELIADQLKKAIHHIRLLNNSATIILTVSPIRHGGFSAHENQISKASLLLGINTLMEENHDLIYFPSYEIMMDDLRDYRFYASDMKHPSETAIEYIYNIFAQSFFDKDTIALTKQCGSVIKRFMHRGIGSETRETIEFKQQTEKILQNLISQYPELEYLEKNINRLIKCPTQSSK